MTHNYPLITISCFLSTRNNNNKIALLCLYSFILFLIIIIVVSFLVFSCIIIRIIILPRFVLFCLCSCPVLVLLLSCSMASSRCCSCNGRSAKCIRCVCARNGRPCFSCLPNNSGRCKNMLSSTQQATPVPVMTANTCSWQSSRTSNTSNLASAMN